MVFVRVLVQLTQLFLRHFVFSCNLSLLCDLGPKIIEFLGDHLVLGIREDDRRGLLDRFLKPLVGPFPAKNFRKFLKRLLFEDLVRLKLRLETRGELLAEFKW